MFKSLIELHYSQTIKYYNVQGVRFKSLIELHYSQTVEVIKEGEMGLSPL